VRPPPSLRPRTWRTAWRARGAACTLLLALGAAAGCRPPAASRPPVREPGRLQLFLLVGQSNMAGRGTVAPEDRVARPRVWMLDRDGRWVPAAEPMHFDKRTAGVGPGRSFGVALSEHDSTADIGLVPAAVGGSPITAWEPGAVDAATATRPYDDAIRRARVALRRGRLAGILWHQGESDSNDRQAPRYAERLRALVERFRTDLGAPDVPFLVGELGRFPDRPWTAWRAQVDAAHAGLPALLPAVAYVRATGLEHRSDSLHFSAAAARELGRRYAAEYLRLAAARRAR